MYVRMYVCMYVCMNVINVCMDVCKRMYVAKVCVQQYSFVLALPLL